MKLRNTFTLVSLIPAILYCNPLTSNTNSSNLWQDDAKSQSVQQYDKSGFLLGIDIPFMIIDSTLHFQGNNSAATFNISGNFIGAGLKLGYQTFYYNIVGNRYYVSYKWMGAILEDSALQNGELKLSSQHLLFNADLLFDIPFNFNNPRAGFGIILGAAIGGQQYYDGIYNIPFNLAIGLNFGLSLNFKVHRIEFLTQWLYVGGAEIAEYGKSKINQTGIVSADAFIKHNFTFNVGYSYTF